MIEDRFGSFDVVSTIVRYTIPQILRNRLVPREAQFLVVNAKLDLPLLERLLLRGEIVNIRVGQRIRFSESSINLVLDETLRLLE